MLKSRLSLGFGLITLLTSCSVGDGGGDGGLDTSETDSTGGSSSTGATTETRSTGGTTSSGATSSVVSPSTTGATSSSTTETSGATLDMTRVLTARKVQRRISLGDRDDDLCIAAAEGGISCTIASVGQVAFDQPVDQVTMSSLGYCVILEDQSVECSYATSDSPVSQAFGNGITTAGDLYKNGDGLGVIGVEGGVRFWNGEEELTAEAKAGSIWGGLDVDTCFLEPDGLIKCLRVITLVDESTDLSGFNLDTTRYVSFAQSLNLFAAINDQGALRVQDSLEDKPKTYTGPYVQVAATTDYWCMLSNTGTISCDAYELSQAPRDIENFPTGEFLAVDVNEKFACGVRPTGEVECWGGPAQTVVGTVRLD